MFIIAAWMFFLGVLVGRGTSPLQFDLKKLEKELALMKEMVSNKEREKFKMNSPSSESSKELKFYDALKAPEKDKRPPPPKPKPQPAPKSPPVRESPSEKTGVTANPTVAKPRQTASTNVKESKKQSPISENIIRRLTIQVAAVKDARTAAKLVDKLRVKGYPAYQEKATLKQKGTWYRIRIGSFADADDAKKTLTKLRKDKYSPILVRMD